MPSLALRRHTSASFWRLGVTCMKRSLFTMISFMCWVTCAPKSGLKFCATTTNSAVYFFLGFRIMICVTPRGVISGLFHLTWRLDTGASLELPISLFRDNIYWRSTVILELDLSVCSFHEREGLFCKTSVRQSQNVDYTDNRSCNADNRYRRSWNSVMMSRPVLHLLFGKPSRNDFCLQNSSTWNPTLDICLSQVSVHHHKTCPVLNFYAEISLPCSSEKC